MHFQNGWKHRLLMFGICVLTVGTVLFAAAMLHTGNSGSKRSVSILRSADCTELLLRYGIAVQQPPLAIERIRLPQEANAVYEAYLQLQERQGLSLREHHGKDATLYLYEAAAEDAAWITLIVCDGELVAADITDETRHPSALF